MYEKFCEKCGRTLTEFYSLGMLGCPHCYKVFAEELKPVLKKIQGAYIHNGKSPKISGVDKELLTEYFRLREEKEMAGLNGDFSEMAKLSREIFDLQTELENRGLL